MKLIIIILLIIKIKNYNMKNAIIKIKEVMSNLGAAAAFAIRN